MKGKDGSPGGIALDGVRYAHAQKQSRNTQAFSSMDTDIKRHQSIDRQG